MGKVSVSKAREILKHGEVKGHKLTEKQKGYFGARAGGEPERRKIKGVKGSKT